MRSFRVLAVVVARRAARAPRATRGPTSRRRSGPRAELGHSGRWLTDEWGRVVNLHGVNFVKKFPPISPAAAGFGADDAAFLHDQGFNVVRLGVVFGSVMPQPGVIDQAYVDSIASTVRVLAHENIFTLLDFHQDGYGPLVHGNGFPEWATLTDGLPNPNDPFPTYYLTNPAMQRAFDNFWLNKPGPDGVPLQTHYAEAVHAVAAVGARRGLRARLRHVQRAVARRRLFDTCLAPGCPDIEAARLVPFGQRMTAAIRIGRPRPLRVQRAVHAVQLRAGRHVAVGDRRAARRALVPRVRRLTPTATPAAMDRAIAASTRGDALLATEFGATTDTATLRRQTGQFDTRLIPWIFWSYDENLVHDLTQAPTGSNVQTSTLDALVRPNPMVTNGTPTSSSFDPTTGAFDYTYRARHPDGTTRRPEVPDEHPAARAGCTRSGYTVTVDGATVAPLHHHAHAARTTRRATDVHVHVTRGGPCGRPKLP